MTTLHGNWLIRPQDSVFFLWGEQWQGKELSETKENHPFCLESGQLAQFIDKFSPQLDRYSPESIKLSLPSYSPPRKKYFLPLLSGQILEPTPKSLSWQPWQVSGLTFSAGMIVQLWEKLPLAKAEFIGNDLRFWLYLHRWSLDLLARGKFLAGINQGESCWYPLLDSTIDRTRLAKFIQTIPPVCLAYQENSEPQTIILDCLKNIVDARLRQKIDSTVNISPSLMVKPWLQSLSGDHHDIALEAKNLQRLENAYNNWVFPIQESLVNGNNRQLIENQYRVCLCLQPPSLGTAWKLTYYLQALDDPEFLISAKLIWLEGKESYHSYQRVVNNPQEILLKGLGLAARLYEPIRISLEQRHPEECSLDSLEVYQFIRSIAWQLQEQGLGVILPRGLTAGSNEQRLGIKIAASVTPKKGERLSLTSLLNFQLKLVVGEQEISKKDFDKLLEKKSPVVEVGGKWLILQPSDVKAAQGILNNTIAPLNLSVEDALRLSSGDNNLIAKLPVVNFQAEGALKELIDNLNNNQGIQLIHPPREFRGELRPYQLKGVSWLAFLEKWGLGACLADDMGLGKTPQLIAFLLALKEEDMLVNPVLVVAPTSVVNNWEHELRKFAPTLAVFVHHGEKRLKGPAFAQEVKNKSVVITSYPLIYRDLSTLEAVQWQGLVLDEAQNIKNSASKQSQAVRKIPAGFRIALTGTPVENRLTELWSILDFLNPNFLGTQAFFQRRFALPIEKYGDQESLHNLRSLVRPFILRRLKTDKTIIEDLPEKQEMNVLCGLSKEQGQLYQQLVETTLQKIEETQGIQRHGLILTLLMQLKQICNHPAHFLKENSLETSQRSGKLLRLEAMVEEVIAEGDRALIFTQFAEWGKLLQTHLHQKLAEEILFLSGSTKTKDRVEMIERFQNDPQGPKIFILSLKAGGTGLNLTRANHVFHIDRWWNPAVENQATDRAFRIGQKRNVQVHKFICTGTLEERINEMIESKKQLAEQTVDAGENWLTELDTDRLRDLLLLDRSAIIDEEETD
ncbi:DEAD/DEAH box helicase [Microcystis aeruginosa]|uniref:ATP-dependent helicase n=1 Tax=Microcystis aeruginosa FD4 TaxID=2686288 RepID=A0A857D5W8_MICAE|nr:DEAD/DEAH box helicase [Microcystis aeruginosa]QGZ91041.1 ATP-dependent helicase [Microcystis aeruginosa FD4]